MNQPFDYNNNTPYSQNPQNVYTGYYPYDFTPKTHIEKKSIKKIANIIGACGLFMAATPSFLQYVLWFFVEVMRLVGLNPTFIAEPAFAQLLQIFFSIVVFLIPFTVLFKVFSFRISDLISFAVPKGRDVIPYFLMGISFCTVANITVSYLGSFFSAFGFNYEAPANDMPRGIFGFMLTFIATAIVPALVEEFACRGIMLGALKKYGHGFAVVTTAIIFGVLHGNFQQIPFAFLVGLVLGFITVKTGSIWIAIFVHAFNNAASVVFSYLLEPLSQPVQTIIYSLFLAVTLLLGLLAVCMLFKRTDAYTLEKEDVSSTTGKRYLWFFTAPTVIIFVAINIIESFTYFK